MLEVVGEVIVEKVLCEKPGRQADGALSIMPKLVMGVQFRGCRVPARMSYRPATILEFKHGHRGGRRRDHREDHRGGVREGR